MGHFTGEDLNGLSVLAYQALMKGRKEEALELSRKAALAAQAYYGKDHVLTKAAERNYEVLAGNR